MTADHQVTSAVFDLSLNNTDLYHGCHIQEVAGRLSLMTPMSQAISIVCHNAQAIVDKLVADSIEEIILSGMAIWAYLVVFHIVVHRFRRIYYDDGKPDGRVLVAVH